MQIETTVEMNIKCPLCGFVMPMIDVGNKKYLHCKRMGCGYYNVRFELPKVQLEVTEESKELLIERSILNKEW